MSATTTTMSTPECMQVDDYAAAEAARQRLTRKTRFGVFASLPNLKLRRTESSSGTSQKRKGKERQTNSINDHIAVVEPVEVLPDAPPPVNPNTLISLEKSAIDKDEDKNVYRWAILYENQRGATVFSTPYYSRLSLLPTDPSPFTVPSASPKRSLQPNVSLTSYPLPDGTWRWVSKAWMIDMRTDSGEVQHDGFEYNWSFRKEKWRAQVGTLSAGGWVRRRRWVRLMMRPASSKRGNAPTDRDNIADNSRPAMQHRASWIDSIMDGTSDSMSSSSVVTRLSEFIDDDDVWRGDNVERDWARCHAVMKRFGRDGRKLELWKKWLRPYIAEHADPQDKGKQKQKQWTEDDTPMPSEMSFFMNSTTDDGPPPPLEHIAPVLRKHGNALLRSFIFPESRAQFITVLDRAGLLPELSTDLGVGWSASEVDFWSYANRLEVVCEDVKGSAEAKQDLDGKQADGKIHAHE